MTADPIAIKPKLSPSVDTAKADPTAGTIGGTVKSQRTQPFRPQLDLVAAITPTADFYSSIQQYIDTVIEQLIVDKVAIARHEIKAEYDEKILSLVKQLGQQESMLASSDTEAAVKSFILAMQIPNYLESVILKAASDGYLIVFIHNSEDRVKALHELEETLSVIEDQFPEINFEPTILHKSDTESYSQRGTRIDLIKK